MKPWLKAGLISGILLILLIDLPWVLTLFIPFRYAGQMMLFFYCFSLLFFLMPGILGAHWLQNPRTLNQGTVTGALAGLVSGAMGSLSNLLVIYLFFATDLYKSYLNKIIPAELSEKIQQEAHFVFPAHTIFQMVTSFALSLVFFTMLNSLSGFLYVVIRKR